MSQFSPKIPAKFTQNMLNSRLTMSVALHHHFVAGGKVHWPDTKVHQSRLISISARLARHASYDDQTHPLPGIHQHNDHIRIGNGIGLVLEIVFLRTSCSRCLSRTTRSIQSLLSPAVWSLFSSSLLLALQFGGSRCWVSVNGSSARREQTRTCFLSLRRARIG